ncbi:MAG: elongation factor Ts [Patescibacteria group bacterium]
MITSEQIKALRDKTGISVMACKKALEEAEGDEAKALEILKDKSAEQAAKKGDREFGAGIVEAYIHSNGLTGSMIELACETDFVSNNIEFKTMAKDIAMQVVAFAPVVIKESEVTDEIKATAVANNGGEEVDVASLSLLTQPFIKNGDLTIQGVLDAAMQKFGERIEVLKFSRFEIGK